jgi:hypothetical protein
MINLPTIQILIHIKETLAQYYAKVKGKNYDLLQMLDIGLDFRTVCPICGGKNCARFIKYYTRGVIDENVHIIRIFPLPGIYVREEADNVRFPIRPFHYCLIN